MFTLARRRCYNILQHVQCYIPGIAWILGLFFSQMLISSHDLRKSLWFLVLQTFVVSISSWRIGTFSRISWGQVRHHLWFPAIVNSNKLLRWFFWLSWMNFACFWSYTDRMNYVGSMRHCPEDCSGHRGLGLEVDSLIIFFASSSFLGTSFKLLWTLKFTSCLTSNVYPILYF